MLNLYLIASLGFALASPPHHHKQNTVQCNIILDGRVRHNITTSSFDSIAESPFNTQYVKGENLTWSQIILLPDITSSRFDTERVHRPFEVTINDSSLFHSGQGLQLGFRRAGLLLRGDENTPGADGADRGVVTFHWSVRQDQSKPLNLSHEYMNVWHEKSDYSGNQFSFVGGVVLPVDGGTGVDNPEQRNSWKIQGSKNNFVFQTPIQSDKWQNFAVQLDYENSTMQVFYSVGDKSLERVTGRVPNDNAGGGQLQLGIAKKPTETETVVWDGYQEHISQWEGQLYGGVFVENSTDGCVST